jgi:RNA polymerase sigma-70 factor (ECF subfamily)
MSPIIDNEQIRKLLGSSPAKAVEILYGFYYKSLGSIARSLTRDSVVAEDIIQETFLAVMRNSRQLSKSHERSIEHYLVRVVRNLSVSYYKRKKLLRFEDMAVSTRELADAPMEGGVSQADTIQFVRRAVRTFPKRERECLMMKIDGNVSPDEIASRLNISRKSVERSLTSAIKRLQNSNLRRNGPS